MGLFRTTEDAGLAYVKSLIRAHPNFPLPGILFQDGADMLGTA